MIQMLCVRVCDCLHLEGAEPLVVVEDHLKALVVDKSEKARIAEVI